MRGGGGEVEGRWRDGGGEVEGKGGNKGCYSHTCDPHTDTNCVDNVLNNTNSSEK